MSADNLDRAAEKYEAVTTTASWVAFFFVAGAIGYGLFRAHQEMKRK